MATAYPVALFPAPRPLAPAAMLASLASCSTESEYREWLSRTAYDRRRLPEHVLLPIERRRSEVARSIDGKARACAIGSPAMPTNGAKATQPAEPTDFLVEVLGALDRFGMKAARFGREAANDPGLIADLQGGREPRQRVKERIRAYIASLSANQEVR